MTTYNIEQAADYLKIDPSTMKEIAGKGEVGAKIGRRWVFMLDDLENYLRTVTEKQKAERRRKVQEPVSTTRRIRRKRPLPALAVYNADKDGS